MNRIRQLRKELDMTQEDLAARLTRKPQAVSKYELEQLDLDTETIRRICEIFGVTADYLLGLSAVRSPELTAEEYALVAAFRAADDHTRELVALALRPYQEEKETAVG